MSTSCPCGVKGSAGMVGQHRRKCPVGQLVDAVLQLDAQEGPERPKVVVLNHVAWERVVELAKQANEAAS